MCSFCERGPDEGETDAELVDRLAEAGAYDRPDDCRVCGAPEGEHNLGCPLAERIAG